MWVCFKRVLTLIAHSPPRREGDVVIIWLIRLGFILVSGLFGLALADVSGSATGAVMAIVLVAFETLNNKSRLSDLFSALVGFSLGVALAGITTYIIHTFKPELDRFDRYIVASITFLFTSGGVMIGYHTRRQLSMFIPMADDDDAIGEREYRQLRILDTSVIIDGRILEICHTGFIDGLLIIPRFVLNELQHIADSTEDLRREKGRRGFDILRSLQNAPDIDTEISEDDFPEVPEVDAKLIRLARKREAQILTNDFNLNKVAELQGIVVLNINELANSVRPDFIAGEQIEIRITREGKEPNQGVGYLADGTMVVVEGARESVSKTVEAVVTQTLQTSAGRMIFTRIVGYEEEFGESNHYLEIYEKSSRHRQEGMRTHSSRWNRKPHGRA